MKSSTFIQVKSTGPNDQELTIMKKYGQTPRQAGLPGLQYSGGEFLDTGAAR